MTAQVAVATCGRSHYVTIVEAQSAAEIYQRGDLDCPDCLHRMVVKHEALVEVFRARLVGAVTETPRCRVHDAACLNPSYCDARDACCAGDPDCIPSSGGETLP